MLEYHRNCISIISASEFQQMEAHLQFLQRQVDDLYSSLNALQSRSNNASNPISPNPPPRHNTTRSDSQISFHGGISPTGTRAKSVRYKGPTSSAFNFDVANSSLQTMGITQPDYSNDESSTVPDGTPAASSPSNRAPTAPMTSVSTEDPLWSLTRTEAIRLCRVYDEEMGMMYPLIDIEKTISKANKLFQFMESAKRTGLLDDERERGDSFSDVDSNILKMVLAVALTVEGSGQSELGSRFFMSVRNPMGFAMWQTMDVKGLIVLVVIVRLSIVH